MEPEKKRRCLESDADKHDESYFNTYADLGIHEEMISDRVRTVTYRLAILKNYEAIRGKVVADIGAGTGILSVFCVQAGAKKVYAIEASDLAVHTERVVAANRMTDMITVINKRVEEVDLPEKVDVIVSEWMGYCLLYENMLPSVLYARDNWLRKGGILLPNTADIYIAPITDEEFYNDRLSFWDGVKSQYEVDMSCLKSAARDSFTRGVHVFCVEPRSVIAHAHRVTCLNLMEIKTEDLANVQGTFKLSCFGHSTVNGFVLWFDVGFPQNITLTTSPYERETHWQQCVVYVTNPFNVKQDTQISGSICLTPSSKCSRLLDVTLRFQVDNGEPVEKTYHLT